MKRTLVVVGVVALLLTGAAALRGRAQGLKGHIEQCKEMCSPGRQAGAGAGPEAAQSCHGSEAAEGRQA